MKCMACNHKLPRGRMFFCDNYALCKVRREKNRLKHTPEIDRYLRPVVECSPVLLRRKADQPK